eukprot:CAMPEP_0182418674 /NCGR_PEP_ID=MMETSP1167-20130531/3044_1 /TAXON_ID=2988 /ORGANISM="Mallomonas Sp, Strain CCMP3275" /LENGTH=283 /DNA_ID=CAMNT_0024592977 /DNA_START=155 /DNA_END=1003 /DNA_ORIENTATION=+
MNSISGRNLYFKCEFLQKAGSFKARGACNAVMKSTAEAFVTHSSGNHGQALAWAAKKKGLPAYVVMPTNSPLCKQRAVAEYGATIVFCEPTLIARETAAESVTREKHGALIHAYNDPDVISGQGTVGLELMRQVAGLQGVVVPVGGGGLISGVTLAIKSINPQILIIAAEPAAADDAYRSKLAGSLQSHSSPPLTIADGLKTTLGSRTWPIVKDLVDKVITVSEDEIRSAVKMVWERMKCVIEPSAGVGVAVVLSERFKRDFTHLQHVGVILCGGNVDLSSLS